jgi:lipoprotein-anchoring transpeptidase ErfK/SrfK
VAEFDERPSRVNTPVDPLRRILVLGIGLALAGCATSGGSSPGARTVGDKDDLLAGDQLPRRGYRRRTVSYDGPEPAGTIIVDTEEKLLYLVQPGGSALRYGVAVGREGFGWKGTVEVRRKEVWPRWFPPAEMIARERQNGRELPPMMEGGLGNPLGARGLYLWKDGRDTLFRLHGTFEPHTIGTNVSSGCIRLANADVIDLYDRVPLGTRVVVR